MPKIKTNRSAAKRFKATAKGKVKRAHAFHRHQMSCKTRKVKRKSRRGEIVTPSDTPNLKRLLPYIF
ncbi:MAG TPA: 50S ribosomal protein L35 [Candidatus Bathyarchaeia archaeon]|nr:50S ribosomal protein L35 [Candidatus Bathyarchaeia archaeon]